MKLIKPSYEILTNINRKEILNSIELIGRTCYKSEDKITESSASKFVTMLIKKGHEAMIEHQSISVKFICDRGVTHEMVRHRIASFAQESTRYCNYSKDKFGNELTFIKPCWFEYGESTYVDFINNLKNETCKDFNYIDKKERGWVEAVSYAEDTYLYQIANGWKPQQARSVLPNSLKTEIVITMNLREWRHYFKLRTTETAHPQIREVSIPLLKELQIKLPEVFNDIKLEN